MDKLQKKSQGQFLGEIKLSCTELELAIQIEKLNMVQDSFRLTDDTISRWSKDITETNNSKYFRKELTPEIMAILIFKIKSGEYTYDRYLGITNIYQAFREYLKTPDKEEQEKLNKLHGEIFPGS